MELNFSVKVKTGLRTFVEVDVHSVAVNEKMIKFANGRTITSTEISQRIERELRRTLIRMQKWEAR